MHEQRAITAPIDRQAEQRCKSALVSHFGPVATCIVSNYPGGHWMHPGRPALIELVRPPEGYTMQNGTDQRQRLGRRGFLRSAAGLAAAGFWADETIEAYQNQVNTNSNPYE